MKFCKSVWCSLCSWTENHPGAAIVIVLFFFPTIVYFAFWLSDIGASQRSDASNLPDPAIVSAAVNPANDPVSDPAEIAALDAEFGDLVNFGYAAGRVYRRNYFASEQLAPGCGPLHRFRGYRILVGKTGSVLIVVYETVVNGRPSLTAEPDPSAESRLLLFLIEDYVAPEEWRNRPVASAWCENGTIDDQVFPELSLWAPWAEEVSPNFQADGEVRYVRGWYWNGTAYVKFDRYTTLVVNNGRLDFAALLQPSSPQRAVFSDKTEPQAIQGFLAVKIGASVADTPIKCWL